LSASELSLSVNTALAESTSDSGRRDDHQDTDPSIAELVAHQPIVGGGRHRARANATSRSWWYRTRSIARKSPARKKNWPADAFAIHFSDDRRCCVIPKTQLAWLEILSLSKSSAAHRSRSRPTSRQPYCRRNLPVFLEANEDICDYLESSSAHFCKGTTAWRSDDDNNELVNHDSPFQDRAARTRTEVFFWRSPLDSVLDPAVSPC